MTFKGRNGLGFGLVLAMAACLPAGAQTWGQLTPTGTPPGPRNYAAAVMDTNANQMIVYGGELGDDDSLTDVWRLNFGSTFAAIPSWTQIVPSGTGPAYGDGSAVYDSTNSRLVVFGGYGAGYTNEVFVLTNANGINGTPTWVQLSPTGAPPTPRTSDSAVYDPTNNRMIVFGGWTGSTRLNDVWVLTEANGLNGTPSWIQLTPSGTAPPARCVHSAVYDATNNRMIIFGGFSGTSNLNDVWVLSNANGLGGTPAWTQLSPLGAPPAQLSFPTAVFDPSTDQMVIFGGNTTSGPLSAVFTLSNANNLGGEPTWTQRSPAGTPGARYGATGVYNPGNDQLIIFGGDNGSGDLNDTWYLDDANWTPAARMVITAFSAPTAVAGPTVNLSVTVANQGTAASLPFPLVFYWSKTSTVTPAAFLFGYYCAFGEIAAGSSETCAGQIEVPAGLTAGAWYPAAIADPALTIPELSRAGNTRLADSGSTQVPSAIVECTAASTPVTSMSFSSAGGVQPANQTCTIITSPTGFPVSAQATTTSGGNWLSASLPAPPPQLNQITSPATLTVSVNIAGLASASYSGQITILATGASALVLPVTLTVARPTTLSISKTHSGDFTQGQQGAQYTVTVSNAAGTPATSGTVTVTETLPAGLSLVSMAGTGWTCGGGDTCSRSDPLAGGGSYPSITVTVNVATTATSPQVNTVSVSGGGSASANATDSTAIGPPASPPTWDPLAPTGTLPGTRYFSAAVLDPSANQMIVFGGDSGNSALTDVWRLSLGATPFWTQVAPSGTAPSYGGGSAVYDATNSRMIVFGGFNSSGNGNQTSVLNYANGKNGTPAWITLSPTGSLPPVRAGHTAVYDTANDRMIVFGGYTGSSYLNDVWVLTNANDLGGTPGWIQLTPSGTAPSARSEQNAVYDQANNRMIVFGGISNGGNRLNDTWVLSNANGLGGTPAWTQLQPTGGVPAGRILATTIFDPTTDSMVLFGGQSTAALSDVWTLANANGLGGTPFWTSRSPGGNPGARYGAGGVYKSSSDELIIFGGNNGSADLNDTWVLDDANWAPAPDMVITALSGPTTITSSEAKVSVTIANQGTASGTFNVEFYWSQTPTITTLAVDSGWGCYNLTAVTGGSVTCSGSIGVPPSLTAGTWYLGAIADPSMSVPELNKTNNSRVADTGATQVPAVSLSCTATSMTFTYTPGGTVPAPESCVVSTVPAGFGISAIATTTSGGNWLSATLTPSGSPAASPATLTVSVVTTGLGVGSYPGNIAIQASGAATLNIPVTLTISQTPALSISKTHSGNFTVGQQLATYTVTVSNSSATGTSGTVTVTENVPSGLTLVSMAGTGWTCPPGGKTCTRSDPLAGGASYLPITVTVNVAATATSPQVNSVSVSGGGSSVALAFDSTTISGTTITQGIPFLIGTVAGTIGTVAENGLCDSSSYTGDNGLATKAQLCGPTGVAVDSSGNLYISDSGNHVIRMVAAGTGIITTVAGNGVQGFSGDNGPATSAELSNENGDIAVDLQGNLYIADSENNRIRKVSGGIITTVAGGGSTLGDNGPAVNAQLQSPWGVAVDSQGNIYIADTGNNRIRKVTTAGVINTIAGTGAAGYLGDNGPATSAELWAPNGVAVDTSGNLYIADTDNSRIREIPANSTIITTVAGNGTRGISGDGGAAMSAELQLPVRVAVDNAGHLYIAEFTEGVSTDSTSSNGTRKVVLATGIITTLAGGNTNTISQPWGVAVGNPGQVFLADLLNSVVTLVNDSGAPASATVAGNANSSDHLTFNLQIQNTNGSQQSAVTGARSKAMLAKAQAAHSLSTAGTPGNTLTVGGTIQYTQTLTRDQSSPAVNNVSVTSSLPSSWNINGCDTGGTVSGTGGNTASVNYPVLSSTDSPTITYTADGPASGPVTVYSNASSGTAGLATASTSQILVASPGASITLSFEGSSSVPTGQSDTYNVYLNNAPGGGAKLNGDPMTITLQLDPNLTNITAPVPGAGDPAWTCTLNGLTLTCTNTAAVASPGQTSFEVTGTVAASTKVGNTLSTAATFTWGGQTTSSQIVTTTVTQGTTPPTLVSPTNAQTGVSTSVSLTWTGAAGETYAVNLGTSATPPQVASGLSATSYTPPAALAANTTYYWQVTATNGTGVTASSPVWSFTTSPLPVVTLVSPGSGANGVSTTSSLSWTGAAGETYAVNLGTSPSPPQVASGLSVTSYTPGTPLATMTTYYWQVTATNPGGTVSSPVWSFTTAAITGCTFTLASSTASLPSAGTATTSATYPGGVLPEVPMTVNISPSANCTSSYSATSSASWLSATFNGNSFAYTALSNAHSTPQSATLTITNSNGGSVTFTVTEAGDTVEPITTRQVRALYESMLGRDPDPSGFTFWTGVGGAGLGQMGDDFLTSPEAFNSDFAVVATYQAATGQSRATPTSPRRWATSARARRPSHSCSAR